MNLNYKSFTLGVEEEYMVLDPKTFELKSHEQKIVQEGQKVIKDKVKAEMHQAVVEVGTDICADVDEAYLDVATLRKTISGIADGLGLAMGASGTHPFSHWESQLITDHVRYNELVNELQEAARSNLIFGLHVHVGMENREMANHIANSTRYFFRIVNAIGFYQQLYIIIISFYTVKRIGYAGAGKFIKYFSAERFITGHPSFPERGVGA